MEQVGYWRDPSFGGIDLIQARFVRHAFGTHAHDDFILCAFEQGEEHFIAAGVACVARQGAVCLIAPHVEHDGQAGSSDGWSYRAFYPNAALIDAVIAEAGIPVGALSDLAVFITYRPELFEQVLNAHMAFEYRQSNTIREQMLTAAVEAVLQAAISDGATVVAVQADRPAVQAAKAFMEEHYSEDIKVNDVALAGGITASHLTRIFRAATGQHVLAYLTQIRLRHARRLLFEKNNPADVAAATGFVDQAHLIRRFKQAFGQTPGRYLRDSSFAATGSDPNTRHT